MRTAKELREKRAELARMADVLLDELVALQAQEHGGPEQMRKVNKQLDWLRDLRADIRCIEWVLEQRAVLKSESDETGQPLLPEQR